MTTGIADTLRGAAKLLEDAADQLHEPMPSLADFELAYIHRAGRPVCVWVRDRHDPDRRVARLNGGGYIDLSDQEWIDLVPAMG